MKTYNIIKGIFAATVLSVVFSGCSEDAMDRINKDHGHTQSVAARFILTDVITLLHFPMQEVISILIYLLTLNMK